MNRILFAWELGALMTVLIRLAYALCLGTFSIGLFAQSTRSSLDHMVSVQRYAEALNMLSGSNMSEAEQLGWLRDKAEQGHVPIQYEVSKRLLSTDITESLKWYARGRLARTLDVAECGDATVSFGMRVELDRASEPVVKAGQANPKLFNAAILDAVDWDALRKSAPPSKWICGESNPPSAEGYVLPHAQRAAKRKEALLNMVAKAKFEVGRESAMEAGRRAKHAVVDSGVPVAEGRRSGDGPIAWLDNETIVFFGRDPKRVSNGSDVESPNALYRWNTKTGKVEQLYQAEHLESLCVFQGFVSFRVIDSAGTSEIVEGNIGKFSKKRDDESRYPSRNRWPNCDGIPPALAKFSESDYVPLLPQHGYLRLTRKSNGALLYSRATRKAVPVQFPGLTVLEVRYDERKKAYVVAGQYDGPDGSADTSAARFPAAANRFFYWLYPGGKVEKVEQPYGFCTAGGGGGAFTPRGMLRHRCLITEGGEEYLAPQIMARDRTALSPDGCRLAVAGASKNEREAPGSGIARRNRARGATLMTIGFCEGSR